MNIGDVYRDKVCAAQMIDAAQMINDPDDHDKIALAGMIAWMFKRIQYLESK